MKTVIFAHEKPTLIIKCSHCGNEISDNWEDHPSGKIVLGISSRSIDSLWGENSPIGFDHPILIKDASNFQNIVMNWSNSSNYRMCRNCQQKLMKHIGDFFKQDIILQSHTKEN